MKKNHFGLIVTISVILIIIILGFISYKFGFFQQTFTPASGSVAVNTETQSTSTSDIFTCKYDQCFVKGAVDVNANSNSQRVVFRYNGDYRQGVIVDTNGDGILEKWTDMTYVQVSQYSYYRLPFSTSTGYPMILYNGRLYVFYGYNYAYKYYLSGPATGAEGSTSPTGGVCPNAFEVCNVASTYTVHYNFCPVKNPSYEFCTKTDSNSTPFTGRPAENGEVPLNYNEQITFRPTDGNNKILSSASFTSYNYDQTCYKNMLTNPPQTCDVTKTNQYYCKPKCAQCNYGIPPDANGQCPGGYGCATWDYSTYKACDGTGTFTTVSGGTKTCNTLKTFKTCKDISVNSKCYVQKADGSKVLGEGWGGCACASGPDACTYGAMEQDTTNPANFYYCDTDPTSCTAKVQKSCGDPRLVFNPAAKTIQEACMIKPSLRCNPGTYNCTDLTHSKPCIEVSIANPFNAASPIKGYVWSEYTEDCVEQHCDYKTGRCSCNIDNLNKCTPGSILCNSTSQYKQCILGGDHTCYDYRTPLLSCLSSESCNVNACEKKQDCQYNTAPNNDVVCSSNGIDWTCKTGPEYCNSTSPVNRCSPGSSTVIQTCTQQASGCYKWINQTTTCTSGTLCANGQCVNSGCSFPNGVNYATYKCSGINDTNGLIIETCINNECLENNGTFTATADDFLTGKTVCHNNQIYKAVKYYPSASDLGHKTKFITSYRWELSSSCSGETPYCLGDII